MNKVVICGGGTGGHVTPGLAVAKELRELDIEVAWLGIHGGIEEKLVPKEDIELQVINFAAPTGGITGYIVCFGRLVPAIIAAKKILKKMNAKAILGLGGYPSLPGVCAGYIAGYRCLLHEQNVSPGLANQFLAPWMHRLLTSYPTTFAARDPDVTGNPVRCEFIGIESAMQRASSRSDNLRLLIVGGSQGANSLNEGVPKAIAKSKVQWQVTHVTGRSNLEKTQQAYSQAGITAELVEFVDDMSYRLAESDLVICRAGAATIAELACIGVAAIFVPYPHARNHQKANALLLEAAGAAHVIDDVQIADPQNLATLLNKLGDREKLTQMGEQARALGKPNAARSVANACKEELAYAS